MKKLMYIAATCGTVILAGCASLDDRLASNDPRVKSAAEHELVQRSRATGTEADRIAAIKRITDKDYLYEIALHATTNQWIADDASFDPKGYDGCASAGTDRVYYKQTRKGPLYTTVRGKRLNTTKEGVAAVGQLKFDDSKKEDFIKLFDLVRKAESDQVKLAAYKTAKDPKRSQTLAAALVRATKDASVQSEALAKMDPEKRLAAIAQNGTDAKERLEAFNKLKDQKAIDEIVLKTNDKAILLAGMSKVSDKAALASRVFGKDFAVDGNAIDLGFALEYLKRVGDSRAEIWSKLAKQGQLQEIETRMARLYRDKYATMPDKDRELLVSAITMPEVITRMIVPPIRNKADKERTERLEYEAKRKIKELDFEIGIARKIFPKIKKGKEEDGYEWGWLEYQTPDLSEEEKGKAVDWSIKNYNMSEFLSFVNEMKSERQKQQKIIEPILEARAKSIYINDKGARATLLATVSPDILDKVFPFKGMLGITLGQVTEVSGGRYESSVTRVDEAEGKMPSAIRVPFTPQHELPQFSSYWYRTSVKSHRVFMIEAQTKTPFRRNEFDLLVKSLEKKYGQKAEKWMGECVYLGESVGETKNYIATKYTFYFPGNRRLVVTDKLDWYASIIAYDDDTMGIAVSEMNEQSREWHAREHKKSADAAQSISDAL